MHISRAQKSDLHSIQHLMHLYGKKLTITESHLNKKDVALQARNNNGELVAFMWAGIMANGTMAYIDKVVCHPDYAGTGIVRALYAEALRIGKQRGVKEAFGIIRQDEHYIKAAANALKTAFGSDGYNYTYVVADINHVIKELQGSI